MHTNWAWTWSSLWPAATEICLVNHQIKFMASFFHHTDAPPLSRGGIRSRHHFSGGQVCSRSLSFSSPYSAGPSSYLFLSARQPVWPRLLPSTSSPILSSHLVSPSFKASAQALSQVLEGRNLAWFFRPVCRLCCGNCLLRGTRLCSAPLSSPPDVNTWPRLLLAP